LELDPAAMPLPDRYGLLISVISPRPIAWVSTISPDGIPNLAPFSFFTGICAEPLTVCFAPVRNRLGKKKDTLVNVELTKQFTINIATEADAEKMNQTSADYPYGVNEFEKVGLTPVASKLVKPPRVKESPVALECELLQVVTISEGPLGGNLVIGKVVHVHVDDAIWKDNRISHKDLRPIGRMEGTWYARTTDAFEMPRPKLP
jgi:flavin reductase (DIM6/NTAB) family NADH-FMN oxidoreductase RutF